jgi:hypothetical protein
MKKLEVILDNLCIPLTEVEVSKFVEGDSCGFCKVLFLAFAGGTKETYKKMNQNPSKI